MTSPWLEPQARSRGIQLNFENMLDDLHEIGPPHLIVGITDRNDVEEYADHLDKVLTAVESYIKSIVGELGYRANTNIPNETGWLSNARGDIVGALRNKADAMLVDEAA